MVANTATRMATVVQMRVENGDRGQGLRVGLGMPMVPMCLLCRASRLSNGIGMEASMRAQACSFPWVEGGGSRGVAGASCPDVGSCGQQTVCGGLGEGRPWPHAQSMGHSVPVPPPP